MWFSIILAVILFILLIVQGSYMYVTSYDISNLKTKVSYLERLMRDRRW